jgi:hypothetical protein
MTIEDARKLTYRNVVHIEGITNARGTCADFRVNGAVRTWKRSPERIRVPLKHGMYEYGAITQHNINLVHLKENCNEHE